MKKSIKSINRVFSVSGESYSGAFIVIEGPDASGKQTQAELVVNWLRESGHSSIDSGEEDRIRDLMPGKYPDTNLESRVDDSIREGVWHLSFPTYQQTPGGRVVDAYLSGRLGDREKLSMKDKVDIFAADRKQFRMLISEYLSNGGIVVCDRYREANLIYQLVGFEGEKWEENLQDIKSVDEDLPDPDKLFYLDISPEEALRRMEDKDKDIHELDSEYMKASNRNGRQVARFEDWTIVDGERPAEEVKEDLKKKVSSLL